MNIDAATVQMIFVGIGETLYMVVLSTLIAYLIGLPMGVLLVVTKKGGIIGEEVPYLKEGLDVSISFYQGDLLGVILPDKVEMQVAHTEPAVKGNTTNNATKDATMETGLIVKVPLFVEEGENIIVATKDGSYVSRA